MAKRNVNLALIAYKSVKGESLYATKADGEVDVHEDDLDRFDALNEQHGDSGRVVEEEHPEPFLDINSSGQGPSPLDHGSTSEEVPVLPEPPKSAPVAAWRAYAKQEGVEDADDLTKAELIAEFED